MNITRRAELVIGHFDSRGRQLHRIEVIDAGHGPGEEDQPPNPPTPPTA